MIQVRQGKLLAAAALLGFGLVVYHADQGSLPGWLQTALVYPNTDKLGHIGVAAGLAFALNLGFIGQKPSTGRFRMRVGSLLTLVLMTVEEFSQVLVARRSFEWVDLGCDVLGVLIGSLVMRIISTSSPGD